MGTSGRATIMISESAIRKQTGNVLLRVQNYLLHHDQFFTFYHKHNPANEGEEIKLVFMGEFGSDSLDMLRMIATGQDVSKMIEWLDV